jgi:hypothetical protein
MTKMILLYSTTNTTKKKPAIEFINEILNPNLSGRFERRLAEHEHEQTAGDDKAAN